MRHLRGNRPWGTARSGGYWLPLFLAVIFLTGGASRADVPGQIVVRFASWSVILALLVRNRVQIQSTSRGVLAFIGLAACAVLVQLIPLPPPLWQALPGRALLSDAAAIAGQAQPWRPLSVSPGLTFNALGSLVVAVATILLFNCSGENKVRASLVTLAALTLLAAVWGALQFSGASVENPLINDVPGMVSGPFANRNHLALFLAIGCIICPVAAIYCRAKIAGWAVVYLIVLFFITVIIGTGSRAGLVLAAAASLLAFLITRRNISMALSRFSGRAKSSALILLFTGGLVILGTSLFFDRAIALDRLFALSSEEDLRIRALPTVWAMTVHYVPFGIGFGAFDPAFRIWEPTQLLQLPYFNHAHNDLIEILLEGGALSAALALGAVVWAIRCYVRAVRSPDTEDRMLAHTSVAVLLLFFLASLVDYPGRTPLIMITVVLAALWLEKASSPAADTRSVSVSR